MPGSSRSASPSASSIGDLHRDALHDLGEIAGRIVGRQQRELGARGGRERQHMAAQDMSRKSVDGDLRLLPDRHVGELRFLVVGDDPDLRQGREGGDLAARRRPTGPGLTWRCPSTPSCGRRDGRVAEIDLGGIERRALRGDRGFALRDLAPPAPPAGARRHAPARGSAAELRARAGRARWPASRRPRSRTTRSPSRRRCRARSRSFCRPGRGRGRHGRPRRLDVRDLQRCCASAPEPVPRPLPTPAAPAPRRRDSHHRPICAITWP